MTRALLVLVLALGAGPLAGQTTEKAAVEQAKAVMGELSAHEYDKVAARGTAQMRAALPADKLAAVWASIEGQAGKFKEVRGTVVSHPAPGITTVTMVCHFEKIDLDTILSFDTSGELAGMFFRPSQAIAWVAPAYAQPASFAETAVTVTTARWQLPGTLTLPKGPGPFPAVVLVQGSGPNDEDETVGAAKPFKDLAWGLASLGIAVLRYEKRTHKYGLASSDDPTLLTVKQEAVDDARSAVGLLASRPGINPHAIFVLGHSLGATLAPRIATGDSQIAGIIVMAGAITPIEKLALSQLRTIAAREHVPADEAAPEIASAEAAVETIESPNLKPTTPVPFLGAETHGAYWLDLRGYHPGRVAAALRIPMLILQGGRDYQVPPSDLELWKQALAGHENVTFDVFPSLNHLFEPGTAPSTPSEYEKPGHVDGGAIGAIAAWVKSQAGRR